jgi:leucyl-tRNA synthetase
VRSGNTVNLRKIEEKWQKRWAEKNIFTVGEEVEEEKYYVLEMFPYPSGAGLHMGHTFNYTIGDIYARFKRMKGFNVLYPMGYDSFGLPAENAAIKAGIHPKKYTDKAIANFVKQQKALGLSYDWDRLLSTCEPDYYRWNQYFFLKFFESGLAYRKAASVNWCPVCETVLANEQVHDGRCWRHEDTVVEQRDLEQWFLKITNYAEELLDSVEGLEWPDRIKLMQKNWIGRSEGVTLKFDVVDGEGEKVDEIETFTTRVDTVYGITYLVLAAEHPKVLEYVKDADLEGEVKDFVEDVKRQSTIERTAEGKEKNGMFLGKYFINPFTGERCPLWVADYALYEYGTGAVMAVPTHDQRDFEFAKKYGLQLRVVISPHDNELDPVRMNRAYVEDGVMVNSGEFNGLNNREAISGITELAVEKGWGRRAINFKLRDWLISRQRYWGTPIPVIHCDVCGVVPVSVKDLPVVLPEEVRFGEGNPLESNEDFVNTTCPKCGGPAKRETDTMDTFVDSSWYFLRYCDSQNEEAPFSKEKVGYWMPVDQYIGGAEHATMHLIYARFFTKALRDLGFLDFNEPFTRLFNQGMIHGEDGFVMSKSRGNIVDPSAVFTQHGIDASRFFLVSLASPNKDMVWNSDAIEGSSRFIRKVAKYFRSVEMGESGRRLESKMHKTIMEVTEDIENFRYNFALRRLRDLFDSFGGTESRFTLESYLKLLHPFCPHITEELWEGMGNDGFISIEMWPECDEKLIDPKYEIEEELLDQVRQDIRHILEIVKEKPKYITIYVAPSWKFLIYEKAVESSENLISVIMKDPDVKKMKKAAVKYGQSLMKRHFLKPVLGQEDEHRTLSSAVESISQEFNCSVRVKMAAESRSEKAARAEPGKPGIELS